MHVIGWIVIALFFAPWLAWAWDLQMNGRRDRKQRKDDR